MPTARGGPTDPRLLAAVNHGAHALSTSLGYRAKSSALQSLAIGDGLSPLSAPLASAPSAIAMGGSTDRTVHGARATGIASIAIGAGSFIAGVQEIGAQASGLVAIAFGDGAQATQDYTVAAGWRAIADGDSAVTIGRQAIVQYVDGIAIGHSARVDDEYGIAIGSIALANFPGTVAMGRNSKANRAQGLAIGSGDSVTSAAQVEAQGGIAFGGSGDGNTGAKASGVCSVAIGSGDDLPLVPGANASGDGAVALGTGTTASHARSAALSQGATTTAVDQIMMGTSAHQTHIPGTLRIPTGAVLGYVLISSATGVASWAAGTRVSHELFDLGLIR